MIPGDESRAGDLCDLFIASTIVSYCCKDLLIEGALEILGAKTAVRDLQCDNIVIQRDKSGRVKEEVVVIGSVQADVAGCAGIEDEVVVRGHFAGS